MIVFIFHDYNLDKHTDAGYRPSYELRIRGISLFNYLTAEFLSGQNLDQAIFLMPSNNGAEWFVRNELSIANLHYANIRIIEYEHNSIHAALILLIDLIQDASLPILLIDNSHIRLPGRHEFLRQTTLFPTLEFAEDGPTGCLAYPSSSQLIDSIRDCSISLGSSFSSAQLIHFLTEAALSRSVFNSHIFNTALYEDLKILRSNGIQLLFESLWRKLGIAEYLYKTSSGIGYLLPSSEIMEEEEFGSIFSLNDSNAYAFDYSTTVLDYNGRYPIAFRLSKGIITRHGVLSENKNIIGETTLANIYPAQSATHIAFVGDNVAGLLTSDCNIIRVACAALASNSWDRNYQHFLIDTLPKIEFLDAHLNPDVSICICDTSFSREIAETVYTNRHFIFLGQQDVVIAEKIAWGISSLAANLSPVTNICSKALARLRSVVIKRSQEANLSPISASTRAYISRRSFHENVGNARVLLNDADLTHLLCTYNFVPITFEGLSLGEKALLLSGRNLFISPVGANLMNLLFCSEPYHLTVIMHPVGLRQVSWFFETLRKAGSPLLSCDLWDCAFKAFDKLPTDQHPYFVDISYIERHLLEPPYI